MKESVQERTGWDMRLQSLLFKCFCLVHHYCKVVNFTSFHYISFLEILTYGLGVLVEKQGGEQGCLISGLDKEGCVGNDKMGHETAEVYCLKL